MYEYKGYYNRNDSNAFEIIELELKSINPSLKMIKGGVVKGLLEIIVEFDNSDEYNGFVQKLIERGLRIDGLF